MFSRCSLERPLTIYLAGAIRDGHKEDIQWRDTYAKELSRFAIVFNPLAGKKSYWPECRMWTLHGYPSDNAPLIVKHDFWMLDHSDILVFNFTAMAEGYPCIGTLVEFGRATAGDGLIYSIIPDELKPHHVFLTTNSAMVFSNTNDCLIFLKKRILALNGLSPYYGEVKEALWE